MHNRYLGQEEKDSDLEEISHNRYLGQEGKHSDLDEVSHTQQIFGTRRRET